MKKILYQFTNIKKILILSLVIIIYSNIQYSMNTISYIEGMVAMEFNCGYELSPFDFITTIIDIASPTGSRALSSYIFPSFTFILLSICFNRTLFSKYRFKNKGYMWKRKVVTIATISAIYSSLMIFTTYIVSSILIGRFTVNYDNPNSVVNLVIKKINESGGNISIPKNNEIVLLAKIIILLFLGLMILGIVIEILNNVINKKSIIFVISYIFFMLESAMDYKILINKIGFSFEYLTSNIEFLSAVIYLLIILIFLLVGGSFIEKEKEVY